MSVAPSKRACWKLQVQNGNENKYRELSLIDPVSLHASRMYIVIFFIFMIVIWKAIWFIFLITHLWRDESFNLFLKMILYGFFDSLSLSKKCVSRKSETSGWVSLQGICAHSLHYNWREFKNLQAWCSPLLRAISYSALTVSSKLTFQFLTTLCILILLCSFPFSMFCL